MIPKRISRFLSLLLILTLTLAPAAQALTPEQAYDLLAYYYVDELPEGLENMTSVEEMAAALGDPYTAYMTAEEYKSFVASINDGSVVGIGVTIQVTAEGLLIASVLDGSPALAAGLVAGDLIIAADGASLAGMGDAATALVRGSEGTQVTLTVRRADGSTIQRTLTRQLIVIPNTTVEVLEETLGYILCDSFGDETAEHFYEGMETYDSQVDSWIVDVRGNPGGTSDAAATAAAYFIGPGVMVYFRDGDDNYNFTFAPEGFPQMTEKQVMVLTSAYSASGAELFAAAIRDFNAGTLMGGRSYGKGVAQLLLTADTYPDYFQDGDALKVTVYRFFSPDGTTNDKIGIIPDLLVSDESCAVLATLLTAGTPDRAEGHLRLTISGITWYIDQARAVTEDNRAAFTELLEAIPPTALLEQGSGRSTWTEITPPAAAEAAGVDVSLRVFSDVAGSAYADQINTLACYGLMVGDGHGKFDPDSDLTRGELAALISTLLRISPTQSGYFSDVKEGDWYANGVNALYEFGMVAGYEDGTYRPESPVTREELVVILSQLGAWLNMDLYAHANGRTGEEDYSALSTFSDWARPAAELCESFGLLWDEASAIDGDSAALREETAALLFNLLVYANVIPD